MRTSDRILVKVGEGYVIPEGYGFAWYNPMTRHGIYFPIPFNVILRFTRWLYFWIRNVCFPLGWEQELNRAEVRGYRTAIDEETRRTETQKKRIQDKIEECEEMTFREPDVVISKTVIPTLKWAKRLLK